MVPVPVVVVNGLFLKISPGLLVSQILGWLIKLAIAAKCLRIDCQIRIFAIRKLLVARVGSSKSSKESRLGEDWKMGIFVHGVAVLLGGTTCQRPQGSIAMFSDKIVNTSPLQSDDHFHWALLQLGGAQFMLNTNYETDQERPLQPEQHRNIAHRDTCLYVGCPDVDGPYLELQNKGLRPETQQSPTME
jgi:hypothetical protein